MDPAHARQHSPPAPHAHGSQQFHREKLVRSPEDHNLIASIPEADDPTHL